MSAHLSATGSLSERAGQWARENLPETSREERDAYGVLSHSWLAVEHSARLLEEWGCPEEWVAAAWVGPLLSWKAHLKTRVAQLLSPDVVEIAGRYNDIDATILPSPPGRATRPWPAIQRLRKLFIATYQDEATAFLSLAHMLGRLHFIDRELLEDRRNAAKELEAVLPPLLERYGAWALNRWSTERLFDIRHPIEKQAIEQIMMDGQPRRQAFEDEVRRRLGPVLPPGGEIHFHPVRPSRVDKLIQASGGLDTRSERERRLEKLVDRLVFDVIVPEEAHCYLVVGAIHKIWRPIANAVSDYIGAPKHNGYRMIHTVVNVEAPGQGETGIAFMVGSQAMRQANEWGRIEEWRAGDGQPVVLLPSAWWHHAESDRQLLARLEVGHYTDPTYVFSPLGQIYELAQYAKPIDYAYAVHSDVGRAYQNATVNGQEVAPDFTLANADIVDVRTDPFQRVRSQALWQQLVRSSTTPGQLRRQLDYQLSRGRKGREVMHKVLRQRGEQYGLSLSQAREESYLKEAARWWHCPDLEAFYLKIGGGDIAPDAVANFIVSQEVAHHIAGADGQPLAVLPRRLRIAQCCRPTADDNVVGRFEYKDTPHARVRVHRADCPHILDSPVEPLAWRKATYHGLYEYLAIGHDRYGLLKDVLQPFYARRAYIHKVQAERLEDQSAQFLLIAEPSDKEAAAALKADLEALDDIYNCTSRPLTLSPSEATARKKQLTRMNPFPYEPARRKVDFVGREQELRRIQDLTARERSRGPIVVYGPWRVGKTSLLEYIAEHDLLEFNAMAAMITLHNLTDLSLSSLLTEIAKSIADRLARETDLLGNYHSILDREVRQELSSTNPLNGFRTFLNRVRRILGEGKGPRLWILIDEFSNLYDGVSRSRVDPVIFRHLRGLVEREEDVEFILVIQAAVIRDMRSQSMMGAELIEVARFLRLGPLEFEAAKNLLQRRTRQLNLGCDEAIMDRILAMTGCNPFVTNILCRDIVAGLGDGDETAITAERVESSVENILQGKAGFHFGHLTELINAGLEWRIVWALAEFGDVGWASMERIADVINAEEPSSAQETAAALARLVDKGFLVQQPGHGFRFQIPLIARWLPGSSLAAKKEELCYVGQS